MAGTGVGKFSSTAGSNTSNLTVNFAENMAPSNVNNAARELMGHIRDMYEQLGDGYFEFGDGDKEYTIARVDADTLTIATAADLSTTYFAGRKIRVTDGGANVVEGTIASTSHGSSLQTVNLTGISLASGTPTKVEIGIDTAAFGGKLILDDDGDTFIEAPTDDTIDIHIAGAKDFVFTANTFTAESGSTIAAQALTATTITTTGAIAIANDGNIGSAGDADSIAISSSGVVTFSQAPVFPDGSIAVADLDIDGATDIGAAIVDADLFIIDDGAGGTNRKVTASRLKTYAGTDLDGAVTINDSGAAVDFRIESDSNTHMLFVDGSDNRVGIGTTPDLGILHIRTADSGAATHTSADELVIENAGHAGISILSATDSTGNIYFNDSGGVAGYFEYNHNGNNLSIGTAGVTRSVLTGTGNLFHGSAIAAEQEDPRDSHTNTNDVGILLKADGASGYIVSAFNGPVADFNRVVDDGNVVLIRQDGTTQGSISVSGATTSYNAFTGSHWSRLADNSKPTILRGTVMESLDTMMDWYAVDYEYDTADGKTRKRKKSITLPSGKSVGDSHTIKDDKGREHTGTIIKEDDVKHVYSKVSTTADSARVYGVFHCWDNDDDTVNDFEVAQVGTYIIRVHKDVTVSAGDLLVSNGDGTAKKQDDDIIRSKTIAKANSNVKVETYADGSYTVPCTLHC